MERKTASRAFFRVERPIVGLLPFLGPGRWLPLVWVLTVLVLCLGISVGSAEEVRTPKVAGQFYPEEKALLQHLVSRLFDAQPEPTAAIKPRILIVPHAGYPYSGSVAARGFSELRGHAYDGVVVVGFTHRLRFDGSSVDALPVYRTPLGDLPVDLEAVARLQSYPGISHVEASHESGEHSLEVELPLLQAALGRFRLVPVLMGGLGLSDAVLLSRALAGLARTGDYLFVFSTDLSHYHPDEEARRIDRGTIESILFETPSALSRLFESGQAEACGRGPLLASLMLARQLGYPARRLLAYATSGDTAGDRSRVVGYATIAMYDSSEPSEERLSREAGQALVAAARESIERFLSRTKTEASASEALAQRYPELARKRGLFVTLRKDGQLRGCVGRIRSDKPLAETVREVALEAALHDTRFSPVRRAELSALRIEVSVLTPPSALQELGDLIAGRDGVILSAQGRQGVFLPQVWEETGWTRREFLRELAVQKAGLPPEAWQSAALSVFQDQVFEEPLPLPEPSLAH